MVRNKVKRIPKMICAAAMAAVVSSLAFAPMAFAERVEGPLRAAPSAYEHIDDEALSAQSEDDSLSGRMFAQSSSTTNIVSLSITLAQMAQMQVASNSANNASVTYATYLEELDPNTRSLTDFADLRSSSGLTAAQIDAYIDSQEKGRNGKLHGMGAAFIRAEQAYKVNAAYLVSHAILETGWGSSDLASGYYYDGSFEVNGKRYPAGTYYNFFGIGAYDSSPISGGRSKAVQEGWNSPEAAVMGGAAWITKWYIHAAKYPQPTLYAMKWDYARANVEGTSWHQYCTGYSWVNSISSLMDRCYVRAGVDPDYSYVIPQYAGSSVPDTNARSMYRLYNPNSGEHFYTLSVAEREMLTEAGWVYEGIGWKAPKQSNTPVYRLYNANGGEHHYTLSAEERDHLKSVGWNYEGIGWYSDDAKTTPLYRQYNPNQFSCNHNYTVSKNENDWLIGLGWKYEGIAWYGL